MPGQLTLSCGFVLWVFDAVFFQVFVGLAWLLFRTLAIFWGPCLVKWINMHELRVGDNLFNDVVFPKIAKQHWQSINISLDCGWHGPMVTQSTLQAVFFGLGGGFDVLASPFTLHLACLFRSWRVFFIPGAQTCKAFYRGRLLSPRITPKWLQGRARRGGRLPRYCFNHPKQISKAPNTSIQVQSSSRKGICNDNYSNASLPETFLYRGSRKQGRQHAAGYLSPELPQLPLYRHGRLQRSCGPTLSTFVLSLPFLLIFLCLRLRVLGRATCHKTESGVLWFAWAHTYR